MSWGGVLDIGVTVIVLIAAVGMLWNMFVMPRRERHTPVVPRSGRVSIQGAPSRGNPSAKVAVLEYADFECPSCAKALVELLPRIDAEYVTTGKVLFVFHYYPLQSIHPSATVAAVAAECAARQDRFWPLHDRLFARRGHLDTPAIRNDVIAVGGDIGRWDACFSSRDAAEAVSRQRAAGVAIGIRGTPTFLIGRRQSGTDVQVLKEIQGIASVELWRSTLDGVLR